MFNLKRWYTNRAIGTLILLLPVMGYLFYEAYLYRNREVVAEQALTAEVQSATFKGKSSGRHFSTRLRLPDGESITLLLAPSPAPHPGEAIPLTQITRASGKVEYKLDRERWNQQKKEEEAETK